MGFPREEYWSGLPFPSPGDFPDPGIEPGSPARQMDSLPPEPPESSRMEVTFFLIIMMGAFIINIMIFEANVQQQKKNLCA